MTMTMIIMNSGGDVYIIAIIIIIFLIIMCTLRLEVLRGTVGLVPCSFLKHSTDPTAELRTFVGANQAGFVVSF